MALRLATWNINSVRLRLPLVLRLLKEEQPDILCLQETKTPDDKFPIKEIEAAGYAHHAIRGEKGYNGVAILSRVPLTDIGHHDFCAKGDTRHVMAKAQGITIHNCYVPAGGDEPDRDKNEKFGHKLDFVDEMAAWLKDGAPSGPSILVGDLNIAPLEEDVWSHKQLLKVVSHTPVEVEKFTAAQASRDWVDVAREFIPPSEKLYSWWSYRARDWAASNRGRRLDHIWITPDLKADLTSCKTLLDARGWEKPSDHVPVIAEFSVG